MTTIKPSKPNPVIKMGSIEKFSTGGSANGRIIVRIDYGESLRTLHDVDIDGAVTGDILRKTNGVWHDSDSLTEAEADIETLKDKTKTFEKWFSYNPVTLTKNILFLDKNINEKLAEIETENGVYFIGNNTFDQSTIKNGFIINDSGIEVSDATSCYYTQYIPIKNMNLKSNFNVQRYYLYDQNKTFLRRTGAVNSNVVRTFDNDAFFVRVQVKNATRSSTMCIVYGDNDNTYTEYYVSQTKYPENQSMSVWLDGVQDFDSTLYIAGLKAYIPLIGEYDFYEPDDVTDNYKCTHLNQYTQSIPELTDILKYQGFLDTYFNIYLGTNNDGYTVMREELGLDSGATATGNIASPIFSYEFRPRNYNRTVLLSAGMNACEASTYFGLAYFVKELMEHSEEGFKALYNTTRFIIMPVMCPSGISHDPLLYANSNGVRINKNFEYYGSWERLKTQNGGLYPDSETETKILKQWLNKYAGSNLWIDCHSDTQNGTVRLTLGGGFTSDTNTTSIMTLNRTKVIEFYRAKGYYGSSDNPDLDFNTMIKTTAPYPKHLYSLDITKIPSIMFEQYCYTTAYGSDSSTNNDDYGIKHYCAMIRHIVLVKIKGNEEWVFEK